MSKPRLVLILGSGFSKEAGVPTTAELSSEFLKKPLNSVFLSRPELEDCITAALKEFWVEVFGYEDGATPPTLEDHFTMLDLAANSGHHLGINWPPKRLRAIRRFSIHRVFQILDTAMKPAPAIDSLFTSVAEKFEFSIVTLNWDIVCENRLPGGVDYGIRVGKLETSCVNPNGVRLLKLHGSSNWLYCDNCRRISAGSEKSALHEKAFLEPSDFDLFDDCPHVTSRDLDYEPDKYCSHCHNPAGGRVATFSFKKDFAIAQFQTIWSRAFEELSKAKYWLLIGYSMPQADYEFRHLLKSTQLAHKHQRDIRAIVKRTEQSDGGKENYERFFGSALTGFHDCGLSDWANNHMAAYGSQNGVRP